MYRSFSRRFRGELFGLGSNHTKYKGKGGGNYSSEKSLYGGTNTNSIGNGALIQTNGQQLQYGTAVHYPNNATAAQIQQIHAYGGGGMYQDESMLNDVY